MITRRYIQFTELKGDLLDIKTSIEDSIRENTQIVNIILTELEDKISEGKDIMRFLKSPDIYTAGTFKPLKTEKNEPHHAKIIDMRNKGMSIHEIAQVLNIPQGEINLQINMYEKKNTIPLQKYK